MGSLVCAVFKHWWQGILRAAWLPPWSPAGTSFFSFLSWPPSEVRCPQLSRDCDLGHGLGCIFLGIQQVLKEEKAARNPQEPSIVLSQWQLNHGRWHIIKLSNWHIGLSAWQALQRTQRVSLYLVLDWIENQHVQANHTFPLWSLN